MMAGRPQPDFTLKYMPAFTTHEKWSVMTGATISKPFTKLSLPSSSKTNDINVEKFENLNYNGKHLLK